MREVFATIGEKISLGRRGENMATCVVFDISEWLKTYGDGTVQLIHQRNGDATPYPCVVEQDGSSVRWCITSADANVAGRGLAELQYYVGDVLVKSATYTTSTDRAMGTASEEAPEPQKAWVERVLQAASDAGESAATAEEAAAAAEASAEALAESERNAAASEQAAQDAASDAAASQKAAADSEAAAENAAKRAEGAVAGVASFNGRSGAVMPQAGDYTADMVGAVNPNLLDNWHFADPIDQRGGYVVPPGATHYASTALDDAQATDTYYTYSPVNSDYGYITVNGAQRVVLVGNTVRGYEGNGYSIDRWYASQNTGSTNIVGGAIVVDGAGANKYLRQYIDPNANFAGLTLTFSALISGVGRLQFDSRDSGSNASKYHVSFSQNEIGMVSVTATNVDFGNISCAIRCDAGSKITVIAVKLELGSTQTLAHQDESGKWVLNEIPDKGEELLKCCMSTADSSDTYANNKMTAAAFGALAENAPLATDLHAITKNTLVRTNENTLNTPYKDGVTAFSSGSCWVAYANASYASLVHVSGGKQEVFVQQLNAGNWSGWTKLATADTALMRDGSNAMTGALTIISGWPNVRSQHSGNNRMADFISSGNSASVICRTLTNESDTFRVLDLYPQDVYSSSGNALVLVDVNGGHGTQHIVLHTGNKPSGSYTGNGDKTARAIATGGLGSVVMVWSWRGFALLTWYGAFLSDGSGVFACWNDKAYVNDGFIHLITDDAKLNTNGTTYYYQVL